MKILLVDDDKFRVSSLRIFLLGEKLVEEHNFFHADSVSAAKSILENLHFDVLILDVVIPKDSDGTGSPSSKNAIELLTSLSRVASLKKPSKIIGITSHLTDLGRFQESFRKHCIVIIEANRKTIGWKSNLAEYIGYDQNSKMQRCVQTANLQVITVHGIRTFGQWQNRLKTLVNSSISVQFHSYKYGYKSALALFSKSRHSSEVAELSDKLMQIFRSNPGCTFAIFCHSFGTYLIIEALRLLINKNEALPVSTVVLAGSVLENNVDLSFLFDKKIKVVNDCADKDYVLWLSEAVVPFLGMAGKTGIHGMENKYFANRYFAGGHSSYFSGDEFMHRYWVPLLNIHSEVSNCDARRDSPMERDIFEGLICSVGAIKRFVVKGVVKLKFVFSELLVCLIKRKV